MSFVLWRHSSSVASGGGAAGVGMAARRGPELPAEEEATRAVDRRHAEGTHGGFGGRGRREGKDTTAEKPKGPKGGELNRSSTEEEEEEEDERGEDGGRAFCPSALSSPCPPPCRAS